MKWTCPKCGSDDIAPSIGDVARCLACSAYFQHGATVGVTLFRYLHPLLKTARPANCVVIGGIS